MFASKTTKRVMSRKQRVCTFWS